MSTVATLAIALTAHHEGFVSGMEKAARSHDLFANGVRSARSVIEATKTSAQIYEDRVATLDTHLKNGKINAEQYAKALESVKEGYERATEGQGAFSRALEGSRGLIEVLGLVELGHMAVEAGHKLEELVHRQIEAAEQTEKLSRTLGVSTQSLQRLQYAAEATRVGTDTLAGGLEKMERTLGDAAAMGGAASAKLAQFGLDAQQLVALRPDEAFAQIADKISGMGNAFDRAAAAAAVFGRGGLQLLPILSEGRAGLEEFAAAADRSGYALSNADNESIVKAGESLHRLELAIAGAGNALAVALAPFIELAANKLNDFAGMADIAGKRLDQTSAAATGAGSRVEAAAEQMLRTIGPVINFTAQLAAGFYDIDAAALDVGYGVLYVADAFASLGNVLVHLDPAAYLDGTAKEMDNFVVKLRDQIKVVELAHDDLAKTRDKLVNVDWGSKAAEAIKSFSDQADAAKHLKEQTEAAADAAEAMQRRRDALQRPTAAQVEAFSPESLKASADGIDQISQRVDQLRAKLDGVRFGPEEAELHRLQEMYNALAESAQKRIRASNYNIDVSQQERANLAAVQQQIIEAQGIIRATEAAQAQRKVADEGNHLIESLQGQIEAHGKSAAQLEIYRLRLHGATEEVIAHVQALAATVAANQKQDFLQGLADKAKEAEAAIHGVGEAAKAVDDFKRKFSDATPQDTASVEYYAQQIEQAKTLKQYADEAHRLAESGRTPQEKHAEQLDHLKSALEAGAITWDEYAKAVAQSNAELEKAARHSQNFKTVDVANTNLAALAGTAQFGGAGGYVPPAGNPLAKAPNAPPGVDATAQHAASATDHTKLIAQIAADVADLRRQGFGLVN